MFSSDESASTSIDRLVGKNVPLAFCFSISLTTKSSPYNIIASLNVSKVSLGTMSLALFNSPANQALALSTPANTAPPKAPPTPDSKYLSNGLLFFQLYVFLDSVPPKAAIDSSIPLIPLITASFHNSSETSSAPSLAILANIPDEFSLNNFLPSVIIFVIPSFIAPILPALEAVTFLAVSKATS